MSHDASYKISPELNPLQALDRIRQLAKRNCREGLQELYKKTTKSPAMKTVVLEEVKPSNGETLDVSMSKFFLKNFKESVKTNDPTPYNFTTRILVWVDGDDTILSPQTEWGSSEFLSFLGTLDFLKKCTPLEQISGEPTFHMHILDPENFFEVDPAWGSA